MIVMLFVLIYRPRNEQEMKSQQLDLPPILIPSNGKKMIKPNGNPRYMVSISISYQYNVA